MLNDFRFSAVAEGCCVHETKWNTVNKTNLGLGIIHYANIEREEGKSLENRNTDSTNSETIKTHFSPHPLVQRWRLLVEKKLFPSCRDSIVGVIIACDIWLLS